MNLTFVNRFMILISIFLLILLSPAIMAKQLSFNQTDLGASINFKYHWLDENKNEQTFDFELSKQKLSNEFRHFKALRPSLLKMFSLKQLKIAISELNPKEGQVKILPSNNNIEFSLRSRDPEWNRKTQEHLNKVYTDSLKAYLQKEYYIEFDNIVGTGQSNDLYFKPDHHRFVLEGTEATLPIVNALKEKLPGVSARKMAEFLLSWIQTIPYDEIEDRTTSNGAGYLPPIHVISNNKGDCDSKATLFAHLMKQIYPNLRMIMIYLPQHALLGINMSVLSDDEVIELDGLSFVLTEPVGPALIPIAEASPSSLRYIDAGIYQLEKLY